MMPPRGTPAPKVLVATTGAATAVGKTAPSSAAAVRAGISRVGEHPFLFDLCGEPLRIAAASYLDMDLCGEQRLASLAQRAAAEALTPIIGLRPSSLPIFIGLPPPRPGRSLSTVACLRQITIDEVVKAGFRPGELQIFETGHCSGTMAVEAGWRWIQSGHAELALCGGVDSYRDTETMQWLHSCQQLHGAEQNPWGFVPGEGSAFTVLAVEQIARQISRSGLLELVAAATTYERNLIKTKTVCTGDGLTELFRTLGAALPTGCVIDRLLSDMNGEPYRADEFGFAVARTSALFRAPLDFLTPCTSWGDVGAATGPLLMVLAKAAVERGWAQGPFAGAFTSAEPGERSGFLIRRV